MPYRRFPGKHPPVNNRSRIAPAKTQTPATNAAPVPELITAEVYKVPLFTPLVQVNHLKIPELPRMAGLPFEIMYYAFIIFSLCGQYVSIYKTVWWYPSSLPPSMMTINFHLIDAHLCTLLAVFFSRRLLHVLLWKQFMPNVENVGYLLIWLMSCLMVSTLWTYEVFRNLFALHDKYDSLKLMFLYYPMLLWVPIYWLSGNSLLSPPADYVERKKNGLWTIKDSFMLLSTGRLAEEPESIDDGKTSYANFGNACDAEQVREEVNRLCRDFNSRLAEIVFYSLLCAYYIGLVPIYYTESYQVFDVPWSLQYAALILMNAISLLASHLLPTKYLQVVHKCACLLGGYQYISDVNSISDYLDESDTYQHWSSSRVYSYGSLVCYQHGIYKAIGVNNTANPSKANHQRFFNMFYKPLRVLNWMLGIHLAVVVYQLYVILFSKSWDQLILPALLQFFSYFILFTTLRDRIVLGKAYAAYSKYPLAQS